MIVIATRSLKSSQAQGQLLDAYHPYPSWCQQDREISTFHFVNRLIAFIVCHLSINVSTSANMRKYHLVTPSRWLGLTNQVWTLKTGSEFKNVGGQFDFRLRASSLTYLTKKNPDTHIKKSQRGKNSEWGEKIHESAVHQVPRGSSVLNLHNVP